MDNKIQKIIMIFLLSLVTQFCLASAHQEKIISNINKLIQHYDSNINIGIVAQSLTTGKIIYQNNANRLFMPASVLKVFPAIASLVFLGPNYVFQTKLLAKDVAVTDGVLSGDLYFYFDADPSLTKQDINNLVETLAQFGIQTINGNIYIDDTVFDQEVSAPGWMWDERNFCYAAPTSAIIIGKNCLPLQLTASQIANEPVLLKYDEYKKFISIDNQVISRQSNDTSCLLSLHATQNNTYFLTGCMVPNTEQRLLIAVRNTRLYARDILNEQLRLRNIKLEGEVKFDRIPIDVRLYTLGEHKSEPLYILLKTMMKKSDNLIADTIYKKLGYEFFHKTATWQNSEKAIAAILSPKTGIIFKKMRMVDGSGLSRYNLVTPLQLVAALRYAYSDKNINQTFIDSLSMVGIDGTLQHRMPNLRGRVYAKTGNMEGISSLVGYIKTKNQDIIAFAITINSFINNHKKYRQLQDKICSLLADMDKS